MARFNRMSSRVVGIDSTRILLEQGVTRAARNALRSAVQAVAQEMTKEIKANTPRRTGNLRKMPRATRLRTPRDADPASAVKFRPDGFYWRMVEYGHGLGKGSHVREQYAANANPYIKPVVERFERIMPTLLRRHFNTKFKQAVAREQARANRGAP